MSWLDALGIYRRPPDPRPTAEIEADVRAEIEHHLACEERALVAQGRTPEVARSEARERFGDVEHVQGACLRIQTGERIMLQRVHLAVTALLLIAVLVLGWSSLRSRQAAVQAALAVEAMRAESQQRLAAAVAAERRARTDPVEHIVIRVGDELEVIDAYNPEMHTTEKVAADGKILLPELGWFSVAGLTREDAEKALTQALAPYFVASDVKVKVQASSGKLDDFRTLELESF